MVRDEHPGANTGDLLSISAKPLHRPNAIKGLLLYGTSDGGGTQNFGTLIRLPAHSTRAAIPLLGRAIT